MTVPVIIAPQRMTISKLYNLANTSYYLTTFFTFIWILTRIFLINSEFAHFSDHILKNL